MLAALCFLIQLSSPAEALAQGRQAIVAKEFGRAIEVLEAGIDSATSIPDAKERAGALAALHFYSAVALSGTGDDARAREALKQFLTYQPGANAIDRSKFEPRFVKLFNEVVAQSPETAQSFDRYYPGFSVARSAGRREHDLRTWGASPEVQILASAEEKHAWERLATDDERREFIANFWVTRDPDPSTPVNEWREEFNRRVAFADEMFAGSGGIAGSITDRGQVFVLLGPPARVRRSNLAQRRARFIEVNGTEERWVYFRPQLPAAVTQYEVDFRFLDQPGYAGFALEREFLPLKAIAEAKKALPGR